MAKTFDTIKPARLILWTLQFVGMWTFQPKIWNIFYRFYAWILHFICTFLFILFMCINVAMSRTLNELSDALYMSLIEIALFVKVLNIMLKSSKAVELMSTFESFIDGLPIDKHEIEIMEKLQNSFRRLRNIFAGFSLFTLLISFFTPFLENNYRLPFPCWLPFDYKNSENYFYAYGYVMFCMTITCISNFMIDLFQAYTLFHLSIYYRLLGKRLRNFGFRKEQSVDLLNKHFNFHASIVRYTKDVQKFLTYPLTFQFILSAFVICFTMYKLRSTPFTESPSAFMMFVGLGISMSLQIYLPCKYGDELTTSANDLTNAIYESNWLNLSLTIKKTIFIYMEYLKKPIIVQAGFIFNVGLNVFSQTMTNAYRLYALLLNIET